MGRNKPAINHARLTELGRHGLESHLGQRNADIVAQYFGLYGGPPGETMAVVGTRYGITRNRVRQIVARSLDRLGAR